HDMTQVTMDVCAVEDVAVVIACPVVAVYPERDTIAIYGGGVHLSKERLQNSDGSDNYGSIAVLVEGGWQMIPDAYVSGISQEHGLIYAPQSFIETVSPGDILLVLPVHSCMSVDLLKQYQTLTGQTIDMMPVTGGV
ncbi:MAG: amidophosphoribosyltransferase, partial [Aggregatilineales bacterium]